jgi:uncharacterized membrane protein YheB (UPF0754 family)
MFFGSPHPAVHDNTPSYEDIFVSVIGRFGVDAERNDRMYGWTIVLFQVIVAGIVGGVTNHFAIKMLFHPRNPVRLGRWKLPFTPGLIPKRKLEIAAALGDVVADYLVTPDGLRELFDKPEFRQSAVRKVMDWADRELGAGATIGGLIAGWAGEERLARWREQAPKLAADGVGRMLAAMWQHQRWGERRICEVVPGWSDEAVAKWADLAAGWGLSAIKNELESERGQALLRKLAVGLMDRTGGLVGFLAGIFMDEDKLVAKLTPFLSAHLESPAVRAQVAGFIAGKAAELGTMTLSEALAHVSAEEAPEQMVQRWIRDTLPWTEIADRFERFPVGEWLSQRLEWRDRWISQVVNAGLDALGREAPRIIAAVRLPELVRTQVERFPVERLEGVILSVSGKEFKAITWLGVALGGFIGLIQSLFMLLWR